MMKKAVLIIGAVILVAGISLFVVKKYWSDPTVKVLTVDWDAMTAQLTVGGQGMTLKQGSAISIGRSGDVIAFDKSLTSIVLTTPESDGTVIYATYATKPA
jgi:hypothetical protein